MPQQAAIIIHQLRTAVHARKKLLEVWRELQDDDNQEQILEELDHRRQDLLATGDEYIGNMLEELITNIRIGVRLPQPPVVPKRF